ncbi:MAG: hypothetical protein BroJett042_31660 [Bacteroidota bacterium]|nr:MAG: hypothetical protein BroJett042_31660 [Bacteroidota bacterium]
MYAIEIYPRRKPDSSGYEPLTWQELLSALADAGVAILETEPDRNTLSVEPHQVDAAVAIINDFGYETDEDVRVGDDEPDDGSNYLTVAEAAAFHGVAAMTVYRALWRGDFPGARAFGSGTRKVWLLPRRDIGQWKRSPTGRKPAK